MFQWRPFTGVGINQFTNYHELTAHNSFVLVLAETGLIGYFAWLAFIAYTMWMLFGLQGRTLRIKRVEPSEAHAEVSAAQQDRDLAVVLLNCLIGFFCAAFFLSRSYIIFLYMICGLAAGHFVASRQRWPQIPAIKIRNSWWQMNLFIAFSVLFFFILVRVLHALA